MQVGRIILIGLLAPLCFSAYAQSSMVISQLPNQGGGGTSDTEFFIFNQPYWQRSADDFVLDVPALIQRCTFWSFYGGNLDQFPEPLPLTQEIRVSLHIPRPDGLPGAVLFEESFVDPARIATGEYVSVGVGPPEYRYELDLTNPWPLLGGTSYWLEIAQIGAPNSLFRWEYAFGNGTPFAFTNPLTDWQRFSGASNLAFQLSTVPEPSWLSPLAMSLLFLIRPTKR